MGFDGKQAIHPNQIEPIYKFFSPPQESIDFARKIVEGSRHHYQSGVGAWEIEGKMIDAPMLKVRCADRPVCDGNTATLFYSILLPFVLLLPGISLFSSGHSESFSARIFRHKFVCP